MLTDILIDRFPEQAIKHDWTELDRRFLVQSTKILERMFISEPEWQRNGSAMFEAQRRVETSYHYIHDLLCEELGIDHLADPFYWYDRKQHRKPYAAICVEFLTASYNEPFGPFTFIAQRLSLIELGFRHHLAFVTDQNTSLTERIAKVDEIDTASASPTALFRLGPNGDYLRKENLALNKHYEDAVAEFNTRLRRAGYKLNLHNGYIQYSDDELTNDAIHEPFWALVADPIWASVDEEMMEAIAARDRNDRTATLHAFSALESVIKVISGIKGWTTGEEKGASHFVNHLQSKKNGKFIDDWEGEMLKGMFSGVRNPFAHGPGADPLASFTPAQTTWAIDTAMSWTKSLITRM